MGKLNDNIPHENVEDLSPEKREKLLKQIHTMRNESGRTPEEAASAHAMADRIALRLGLNKNYGREGFEGFDPDFFNKTKATTDAWNTQTRQQYQNYNAYEDFARRTRFNQENFEQQMGEMQGEAQAMLLAMAFYGGVTAYSGVKTVRQAHKEHKAKKARQLHHPAVKKQKASSGKVGGARMNPHMSTRNRRVTMH